MANYQNFKSFILSSTKSPCQGPNCNKSLHCTKEYHCRTNQIDTDNEMKGIKYLVLRCPSVFTQILGEMCLDTKMVHLYEHFILHGRFLLSEYWREACAENKNRKEGKVWSYGLFPIIIERLQESSPFQ